MCGYVQLDKIYYYYYELITNSRNSSSNNNNYNNSTSFSTNNDIRSPTADLQSPYLLFASSEAHVGTVPTVAAHKREAKQIFRRWANH